MDERPIREQPIIETTASVVGPAGSHCWISEDGNTEIALVFDVVDRLGFDVMRGFGAVPKRGAEVGGILLGRKTSGARIEIEDFLLVPCTHARGPSFLLSDEDLLQFDQILAKAGRGTLKVVGFFRSNTRDVLELTAEDLAVFGARLGQESSVVLLIKPHATRPPEAAFFLRRGGQLSATPNGATFPFRRKDLGGGRAQKRVRSDEAILDLRQPAAAEPGEKPESIATAAAAAEPEYEAPDFAVLAPDLPRAEPATRPLTEPKTRSTWVWLPLSFVFLLLGLVLGFQIALSFRPPKPAEAAPAGDPYSLALSVAESNSSLHLRWNEKSRAVKSASKAVLHIQDGDNVKAVSLGRDDLARGGVLYRYSTGAVAFRLEVFTQDRTSVSESVDIRMLEPAGAKNAKK